MPDSGSVGGAAAADAGGHWLWRPGAQMSKCEKTDSPINYFISFGWLYIRLLLLYSSVVEPCWLLVVHWATRVEHNRCLLHEAHTHTHWQADRQYATTATAAEKKRVHCTVKTHTQALSAL